MTVTQTVSASGVIGIGYQGWDINGFVAELQGLGVSTLVDVRLTPISRKRGFSKTALSLAVGAAGIAYEHYRQLGNPKTNRAGFAGTPAELAAARGTYASILHEPVAADCLSDLAESARHERIALLCFEADQAHCHRDVVLHELSRRMN
ncbi:DUF488 family protein [Actinoplanes sp. L3-i22]|uniref:DUF488 domain-containing protein n=1 Tax=Actinoplanes sp. L3-i22 TaxID=2836373 RepID=UPI001C856146|nr:DUF488 domain-containing protein [Actinoplanes sp. L3-i22]